MRSILLAFFFLPLLTIAQKKQITLEDIFKKSTFRGEFVPGFTTPNEDSLFDPQRVVDESGKRIETREYQVSSDKKRILFFNGREPIYRRSSKSTVYVYDVASKKALLLDS